MNWILLQPEEVTADGDAKLMGRRARHAHEVLAAEPGQRLRVGVINGPTGEAQVLHSSPDELSLRVQLGPTAPRSSDALLLAVPRPKVLLRMLAHAAALGFGEILLFRSWRTDKSHLHSTAMRAEVQREQLLLGLEQSGRTHLPMVRQALLFKPMVEDLLPTLPLPSARFVGHPTASTPTHNLHVPPQAPFALCLGPDGGFLPYELDQLCSLGFAPVNCGPHALRTETALAVLTGQLQLLREQAAVR